MGNPTNIHHRMVGQKVLPGQHIDLSLQLEASLGCVNWANFLVVLFSKGIPESHHCLISNSGLEIESIESLPFFFEAIRLHPL